MLAQFDHLDVDFLHSAEQMTDCLNTANADVVFSPYWSDQLTPQARQRFQVAQRDYPLVITADRPAIITDRGAMFCSLLTSVDAEGNWCHTHRAIDLTVAENDLQSFRSCIRDVIVSDEHTTVITATNDRCSIGKDEYCSREDRAAGIARVLSSVTTVREVKGSQGWLVHNYGIVGIPLQLTIDQRNKIFLLSWGIEGSDKAAKEALTLALGTDEKIFP